ncbi:MAG: TIGR00296 family protein [Archaeoglobi archaeon]|nr:TIGR00296 family protein [Candidatus Mnemosynella bozhongmuii]
MLELHEGELAVKIARESIKRALKGERVKSEDFRFSEKFNERRGVFVTLYKNGELRGCIGFPYPILPLKEALIRAALSAAFEDPRFLPVRAEEMSRIRISVTILSEPEKLICRAEERPDKIEIGKHGIIVRRGIFQGLLLPQVATEYGWDAKTFLTQTCLKAGLPPESWLDEDTEVLIFTGEIFEEVEPEGKVIHVGL